MKVKWKFLKMLRAYNTSLFHMKVSFRKTMLVLKISKFKEKYIYQIRRLFTALFWCGEWHTAFAYQIKRFWSYSVFTCLHSQLYFWLLQKLIKAYYMLCVYYMIKQNKSNTRSLSSAPYRLNNQCIIQDNVPS